MGNAAPSSVLFVCGENALRSPMAEGILKDLKGASVFVDSVGVRDGPLDAMAVEVMAELEIDISGHNAKRLEDLLDTSFDVIVTLSPEAHHQALELTRTSAAEVEYWTTYDPSVIEGSRDQRLAAYRQLRDFLVQRIEERFGGKE